MYISSDCPLPSRATINVGTKSSAESSCPVAVLNPAWPCVHFPNREYSMCPPLQGSMGTWPQVKTRDYDGKLCVTVAGRTLSKTAIAIIVVAVLLVLIGFCSILMCCCCCCR